MKSKIRNPKSKRNPKLHIQSDLAASFRAQVLMALAFLAASAGRLAADVIVLKDGKSIEGTIQERAETYEVGTKHGVRTIRKEEVARILKDAAALKVEAETLRRGALALAEEALKGEMSAEDRSRKLSATEEALQKAMAVYQDVRLVSPSDAAAMEPVVAELNRELARVREKRAGEAPPKPVILETPLAPPSVRPAAASPSSKAPEPGADAQKSALALIRNVYKAEYARRTPDDQKALARRLLSEADKAKDDPIARFALLRESRDLAAAAGDPETAAAAVDGLAADFAVDAFALKADALAAAGRSMRTAESVGALVWCALTAADEALAADVYDQSAAMVRLAAAAAPRAGRDPALIEHVQARAREIAELQREFAAVQKAVKKLAEAADDPDANLAVGRFRCLAKGAWDDGLPLLARGSDPALKNAAAKDLQNPADGFACVDVGDLWWELAEKETARSFKAGLRSRAGHWYAKAASQLTGMKRLKVEERLKQINQTPGVQATPAVQILTRDAFSQQLGARFPEKNNLAKSGKAKVSRIYNDKDPHKPLDGLRSYDSWARTGPEGWFEAIWDIPIRGRRILLFARSGALGNDPWGKSKATINGATVIELKDMCSSKVAVIDMGRAVLLRSVRIDITGGGYPGLAGVEVHP